MFSILDSVSKKNSKEERKGEKKVLKKEIQYTRLVVGESFIVSVVKLTIAVSL